MIDASMTLSKGQSLLADASMSTRLSYMFHSVSID
jgi:hypothetical protein